MKEMPPLHPAVFIYREATRHCPKCGRLGACYARFGLLQLWACPVCDPDDYPRETMQLGSDS